MGQKRPKILNDLKGWDENVLCVPTALAAISGKTPQEVADIIAEIANDPTLADAHRGFSGMHWMPALEKLGFQTALSEDFSEDAYPLRPSIREYLGRVNVDEPQLIYCENSDRSDTHVFALEGDKLVDTWSGGKVVDADPKSIADDYNAFRIKRTYLVWR